MILIFKPESQTHLFFYRVWILFTRVYGITYFCYFKISIIDWKNATFKLTDILPDLSELTQYYRYKGSLTAPPCTEGVIWNVFAQKISISLNQIETFRMNELTRNFRDVQQLNKRLIYSSFYDCSNLSIFENNSISFGSITKYLYCKWKSTINANTKKNAAKKN